MDSSLTRVEHTLVYNKKPSLEHFCYMNSSDVLNINDLKSLNKCIVAMACKIRALGGNPDEELAYIERHTRAKLEPYLFGHYTHYEYDLTILDSLLKKITEVFFIVEVTVDENGFLQYCGDSPFEI